MADYNVPIETGDVLLYRGSLSPLSLGIRVATWSPWTHAGLALAVEVEGRWRRLVVDATGRGVGVRPLSQDVADGNRIAVLKRPLVPEPADATRRFREWAWTHWSRRTPYWTRGLLVNLWTEIAGASNRPDPPDAPRRYICSQLVSYCLRAFWGFDPCPGYPDAVTTPADLARSNRLTLATDRLEIVEGERA